MSEHKPLPIDPQPREAFKTAPSLDYHMGFRAGIEAAAKEVWDGRFGLPTLTVVAVRDAIRNLKPEDGA